MGARFGRANKFFLPALALALVLALGIVTWAPRESNTPRSAITNSKDGSELILIPAGEFLMGSPEGEGANSEHPQHKVYLNAYYIGKTEVTNEQFARFVNKTGYLAQGAWKDYYKSDTADHPVVGLSWNDAVAYCRWAGLRLPTEAEWEKAARGTDGRQYPWGNSWETGSCISDTNEEDINSFGYKDKDIRTKSVDSCHSGASPYGCLNMAGNAWEWCNDWYKTNYYSSSAQKNPQGTKDGLFRVLRGGSWRYINLDFYRCANRGYNGPGNWYIGIGFRVARGMQARTEEWAACQLTLKEKIGKAKDLEADPRFSASCKKKAWGKVLSSLYSESHPLSREAETLKQYAGERISALNKNITDEERKDVGSLSSVITNEKDGSELILIPAGKFMMGMPLEDDDYADPAEGFNIEHMVYLDAYSIGKYEVTNKQFAQFVRETGYKTEGDWNSYHALGRDNHPVVGVSWNDALAYCEWAGLRLPTEAEWEKAARGTTASTYPWGRGWAARRCNNWNGPVLLGMADIYNGRGTLPVGSFPSGASYYGCLDMAGNVREWCWDRYGKNYYQNSPSGNPQGPSIGSDRILRGGSWLAEGSYQFRTTSRYGDNPGIWFYDYGFRAARSR